MQIDAVEIFQVAMHLNAPWRTAYGEDATVETVLLRMHSGARSAWGETCPLASPTYSAEWAGGVFSVLRDWLAPAAVGRSFSSGEALAAELARFKGNPFAKAALDNAWWALAAELAGQPLHRFLGGRRDVVEVGEDFGVQDSIDTLLAQVGAAYAAGYARVKLKFRPGWGLEMLRAVRNEFPTQRMHIDLNGSATWEQSEMLTRLDDFHLEMIEQPMSGDDLIDHARLQSMLRTPLCLDESITSLARAEQAIDMGSCRWINLKPARVGGLTQAVAIHEACRAAGIGCWVGGMLESAVGARIALALATLENCTYPADLFSSSKFYSEDLADLPVVVETGPSGGRQLRCLDASGLGCSPDPERLARGTLAHAVCE